MTKTQEVLHKPNTVATHSKLFFYCGMALMIAMIFARNIFKLPVPVVGILVIGALIAIISTRDEMIALVIACIPMSAAFQYKYFIFICIIIYIVKFCNDVKFISAVFPLALMVIWEFMHGFFFTFSIYESLRGFSELIFCTFLMMIIPQKIDYKMICRLLAIASICMMSIVLLNLLEKTNYNFEQIFNGWYRFGVGNTEAEYFGVNYNANALGFISNVSIAGLLQLIASKKNNIFDYLLIVILVMFGAMTMSRTFLVCFALIVAMFSIARVHTAFGKIKRVLLIVFMILLLIFLVYTFMPTVYELFAARFKVEDISNGRNDLFDFYSDHIFSNPIYMLFGVGIQDYSRTINHIHGTMMNVCHNGTQELVVCWGIPGLVLFIWFIVEMLRHKPMGLKREIVNYIPLFLILLYVQSGQLISNGNILLSLSFAYISLCHNFSER